MPSSSRSFGRNRNMVGPLPSIQQKADSRGQASTYIPLQERSQWSDITPIEQDDGPNPLVPIMYSEECESVYISGFCCLSGQGG